MVELKHFGCNAITVFLVIILSLGVVLATPGIPHQFYGSISVNGTLVPDYAILTATITGIEYPTITKNGLYGKNPAPIFYIPDPDRNRAGKTVLFKMDGMYAGEHTFENAEYTQLNFCLNTTCGDGHCIGSETCDSCPEDCGTCTEPPQVVIYSPEENTIYDNLNIPLDVSSDQSIRIWWYSLNSEGAIVFTPNTTINAIEGQNQIFVFARNYQGQVGSNMIFNFSVELPQPECGNGVKEEGEDCDGNDLGSSTCSSYGKNSGSLSCSSECMIVSSGCYNKDTGSNNNNNNPGGGSLGGGSTTYTPLSENNTNETSNETSGNSNNGGEESQTNDLNETTICEEDWSCGEWSVCSDDGFQMRTCVELNNCKTTIKKPKTIQRCAETSTENTISHENNSFLSTTGRFLTSPAGAVSIFGLLLVLIVGFLIYQKKFAGGK